MPSIRYIALASLMVSAINLHAMDQEQPAPCNGISTATALVTTQEAPNTTSQTLINKLTQQQEKMQRQQKTIALNKVPSNVFLLAQISLAPEADKAEMLGHCEEWLNLKRLAEEVKLGQITETSYDDSEVTAANNTGDQHSTHRVNIRHTPGTLHNPQEILVTPTE